MRDLLGIPDTSFRGLSTLTARSVLRSKSDPTVARILDMHTKTPACSQYKNPFSLCNINTTNFSEEL